MRKHNLKRNNWARRILIKLSGLVKVIRRNRDPSCRADVGGETMGGIASVHLEIWYPSSGEGSRES